MDIILRKKIKTIIIVTLLLTFLNVSFIFIAGRKEPSNANNQSQLANVKNW